MPTQGAMARITKNPLTNADFPELPRSSLFVMFSENLYIKRRIKRNMKGLTRIRRRPGGASSSDKIVAPHTAYRKAPRYLPFRQT